MLQQLNNTLLVKTDKFSRRSGWLNAAVTVLATRLLPHMNAQGCTYHCQLTCRVNDICPVAGELTQIASNNLNCSPPYCFLFTGTCC